MKIAMIVSEANPFAKTGGLADVSAALSLALERLGHQVTLIIPAYRSALQGGSALQDLGTNLSVPLSDRREPAAVLQSKIGDSVTVYLIRADKYFDREFLYGAATEDYSDNAERFVFFCRAVSEILRAQPADIVHAHDWQAALAIVFLKTQASRYDAAAAAKTVLTIHNLAFQGNFSSTAWHFLNLDNALFTPQFLEFYGNVNFLKGGIVLADKITTVSPTYAQEIMTLEQGFGLDGALRQRAGDLVGILNGVDYGQWNPATDPLISHQYDEHSLTNKRHCKESLRQQLNLRDRANTPIVAMISRLTAQKGFDLVQMKFSELIQRDLQFVLLGSGEPRYEEFFRGAAASYPDRVAVRIGFDEQLAHRIEAGADLFLMPSLYEPCGLNQMYSLKYATLPIVRAVGGLKDSVQDYDPQNLSGNGFVFTDYDGDAMLAAIDRGLSAYGDKIAWTALQKRAMAMDLSWQRSAQLYNELYESLLP